MTQKSRLPKNVVNLSFYSIFEKKSKKTQFLKKIYIKIIIFKTKYKLAFREIINFKLYRALKYYHFINNRNLAGPASDDGEASQSDKSSSSGSEARLCSPSSDDI